MDANHTPSRRPRALPLAAASMLAVLLVLLGVTSAGAVTPNDAACRSLLSSTTNPTQRDLLLYQACRFDRLDAQIAAMKQSSTASPAPTASVSATAATKPSPSASATSPTTTTSPSSPTSAPSPTSGAPTAGPWPSAPPAKICGSSVLSGPSVPPTGAVSVPAGDNSGLGFEFRAPGKTFWFAPGVHTVGSDMYAQIQPGDGSTFLGAPGAVIDGKGVARYAFTQHAKNVTIKYLTIRGFVSPNDEGVVNHDSGDGWTISYNTITGNKGAGVFGGSDSVIDHNCLSANGQYGFQVVSQNGPSNVVLDHNEIAGNNTDDLESKNGGCGCTGGGKFWNAHGVKVTNNWVHDNKSVGLWADTNDSDFLIEGNWIEGNEGQAIFYEISYNAVIRNNVLKHNLTKTGPSRIASGDPFPDAAIYLSESGGDSRVPSPVSGANGTIDVSGNLVADNYNGIALWENADRFCGSPSNTSTGYCTMVNTSVATLAACSDAAKVKTQPFLSDCRWKTQNVKVHDNTFTIDRAALASCAPRMCGRNAVFANMGSTPSWSPYQGDVVQKAIVYGQGNVFSHNTYTGGWNFTAPDPGGLLTAAQWQATPYKQDAGSVLG